MELFWNGIKLGLALSVLTGPIIFTLLQTSIEQGFRAGLTVAAGIWLSDLLFVAVTFLGVSYVAELAQWDGLEFWLGVAGGIILLVVGGSMLLLKPPPMERLEQPKAVRHSSLLSLWTTGFLINTVNPFTFFFWLGVSATLFTKQSLKPEQAELFYCGLFGTIIFTDTAKVGMAKYIRRWLKPQKIILMRKIAGAALLLIGVGLFVRAFYPEIQN
ncbi:MAG: LysE family transporter [Saprospiraceae bacterium]|nr:LysE family transporter [Saprospiraceae bacterium]